MPTGNKKKDEKGRLKWSSSVFQVFRTSLDLLDVASTADKKHTEMLPQNIQKPLSPERKSRNFRNLQKKGGLCMVMPFINGLLARRYNY